MITVESEDINPRPRIAVMCDDPTTASSKAAQAYLREMRLEPVLVTIPPEGEPCDAALEALVRRCNGELDGALIMGSNGDIDPSDYGQVKLETTKEPINRNRKPLEEALIQWALEEDKPLLGICAGMQRLNVYMGGQLLQHVEGEWQDPKTHSYETPTEKVVIKAGTTLGSIAGQCCKEVEIPLKARSILGNVQSAIGDEINSIHHQAVDPEHVPTGLRISASSHSHHQAKDIVEAIESTDPNRQALLMGVQWHPEFLECGLSQQLFGRFAEHARNAQVQREKQSPRTDITAGGVLTRMQQSNAGPSID